MRNRQMRFYLHWTLVFLSAPIIAFVAVEVLLNLYVNYIAQRHQLFRPDPKAGWINIPNLDTTRTNSAHREWRIITDHNGHRMISQSSRPGNSIFILGDSLAFGEGVDIEDRFDVKMQPALPGKRIINTGTMGYGTDQEYVVFRKWKDRMKAGDTILILLNESDYFDVLRRRFAGRAKPYFEVVGNSYVLRPPEFGFWERWSDRSIVASIIARTIEPTISESLDLRQSIEMISYALARIRREAPAGVKIVLAHQGTRAFLSPKLGLASTIFCGSADHCIDLDGPLASDPAHLLPDGHWSSSGHTAVAEALVVSLR